MLNGKFFTGLPPGMIDRSGGKDRQQSHFFWPDETNSESVVDSRSKRRQNQQNHEKISKAPQEEEPIDARQMFGNEFSKSSIKFYDKINKGDLPQEHVNRNNKNKNQQLKKLSDDGEDISEAAVVNRQAYNSKIKFYDFPEDNLNNSTTARTDKNINKGDTKNSPKLQNKTSLVSRTGSDRRNSFDHGINVIENNVKNMNIRRSPPAMLRRQYTPPPPFDDYNEQEFIEDSHNGIGFSERDFMDTFQPLRRYPMPRHYRDNNNASGVRYDRPLSQHFAERNEYGARRFPSRAIDRCSTPPQQQLANRAQTPTETTTKTFQLRSDNLNHCNKNNSLKVNKQNDTRNTPSPSATNAAKHLRSNICFSDNGNAQTMSTPSSRKNIRSTAINRVSVGLPN